MRTSRGRGVGRPLKLRLAWFRPDILRTLGAAITPLGVQKRCQFHRVRLIMSETYYFGFDRVIPILKLNELRLPNRGGRWT
jgi:hypothetical protein